MTTADRTWTDEEARERAAFVLGVRPGASTAEARDGYRAQLDVHRGDSDHARTARRTLMAAWAVWHRTTPEIRVDRVGERDTDDPSTGVPRAPVHDAASAGSVEVVEVVRDDDGWQAVWHPVAGDHHVVLTDGERAHRVYAEVAAAWLRRDRSDVPA